MVSAVSRKTRRLPKTREVHACSPTRNYRLGIGLKGPACRAYIKTAKPQICKPIILLGRDQSLALTNKSYQRLKTGLDTRQLPATIRDALAVASGLGLRYLWVDALCIFQDDDRDKAMEIDTMPSIYSQAAVTIVASRSATVHEGFLQERPLGTLSGFALVFLDQESKSAVVSLTGKHEELERRSIFTDSEPLSGRAWALQERILSPRALDFRTVRTVWSCPEFYKTSGFSPAFSARMTYLLSDGWEAPQMYTESVVTHVLSLKLAGWKLREVSNYINERPSGNSLYHNLRFLPGRIRLAFLKYRNSIAGVDRDGSSWRSIAEPYSRRQLSIADDRLPALSVVARLYQIRNNDNYVAGLWVSHLPCALLWRREFSFPKFIWKRSRIYCGPTWSWVSVIGPILLSEIPSRNEFKYHFDEFRNNGVVRLHSCHLRKWAWKIEEAQKGVVLGKLRVAAFTCRGHIKPAKWKHIVSTPSERDSKTSSKESKNYLVEQPSEGLLSWSKTNSVITGNGHTSLNSFEQSNGQSDDYCSSDI